MKCLGLVGARKATISALMRLPFRKKRPVVSVVRLEGIIRSGNAFGQKGLNDVALAPQLEKAFRKGKPQAVALEINSPGGSPVQSSLICARIRRLADEKKVPVYAFVEDLAASGGYWIALASDEIYADQSSIVGSIGVMSSSFGFHELLAKSGIERRLYTAGEDKSLLDPFLPQNPKDVRRLKDLQEKLHDKFISHVKERRGSKLNGDDLFTGKFWTGEDSFRLGLVDGISYLVPKMKELYGDKVKFNRYDRRRRFGSMFGADTAGSLLALFEERAILSRYGL